MESLVRSENCLAEQTKGISKLRKKIFAKNVFAKNVFAKNVFAKNVFAKNVFAKNVFKKKRKKRLCGARAACEPLARRAKKCIRMGEIGYKGLSETTLF